jgi:hypothetical protein
VRVWRGVMHLVMVLASGSIPAGNGGIHHTCIQSPRELQEGRDWNSIGGARSGFVQLLLSEIIPRSTAVPSFSNSVTSERSLNVLAGGESDEGQHIE